MGLIDILGMLGCSTIVGSTCAFFIQRYIKKRDRIRDEAAAEQKQNEKAEQDAIKAKTEELEKQNKATQLGVQALLRDRLLQAFRHYIEKGWADYDDRTNLENMYVNYEALGPNSVMETLYNEFNELPSTPQN